MCGILGVYSQSGQLPSDASFTGAADTIQHRGPDDFGTFRNDEVLLGHRRLAIIDLNTGHQPIHNSDKSLWVVFNGEIYNYVELQAELKALGYQFYTETDTEVIVHAYAEWGVDGFKKLRGMFAIALWDNRNKALVLARDPLGKKPLYFSRQNGFWAFGSELKALQALPETHFTINDEACRDFALMGYVPTPKSIYNEAHKLKPGHCLIIKGQEAKEHRFWELSFEPKHQKSEAELVEELDHILNESVRIRLRSDVPFGAFLSGGLDSSIVATLMAKHMDQPVKTYSIGFKEAEFNELSDAEQIAKHIGSEHHEFIVEASAVSLLDKLSWHFDEPFADSSAIPTYLVAEMASKHVKMVLSGDGGDEAFGGYERYLKYQIVQKFHSRSLGMAGPLLKGMGNLIPHSIGQRINWLGERLSQPFPARYISGVSLATPEFTGSWLNLDTQRRDYGEIESHFNHGYQNEMDEVIHGDIRSYLLDDILVKVDRTTMANSLESRSPLLDHELISWAAKLPNHYKMRDGKGKYLLRKIAEQILPPESLTKRKQGFAIPLAHWLKGELKELALDTFNSTEFKQRGIFNTQVVNQCMQDHLENKKDYSENLWQCLVFELWARKNLTIKKAGLQHEVNVETGT